MAESSDAGTAAHAATRVEVGELLARLDAGEPILLLDVRNEEEYAGWKLEARRAVETVHVPYFEFLEDPDAASRVPRDRELVVVCAHGGSSEYVAGVLSQAGIPAKNLSGGMLAYGAHLEPVKLPLAADESGRFAIWQVNRRGKGCLSYLVVAHGEAVVVDPSRHAQWYEAFARERGARIVRVLDTHVHADHVSGGPGLARRLGVPYGADGQPIRVGGCDGASIEVVVMSTPGHTPGSTCFLVEGRYLLTGDTLFVASVGRPDLGGHVVEWGRELFATLRRLAALPGDTRVLPAHYASLGEVSPDGVVWGRVDELRRTVPELQIPTAAAFVEALRGAVAEPPAAYAEIVRVNLGAEASDEQISEWELGKNQCAAASRVALRRPPEGRQRRG